MRRVVVLAVGVGLLSGCGGGNAKHVLAATADNLAKIHSGRLDLRFVVVPSKGDEFGFTLRGPFALRRGSLPVARIAYTQIANGRRATAVLVSSGSSAYALVGAKRVALSAAQQEELRMAASQLGSGGGG